MSRRQAKGGTGQPWTGIGIGKALLTPTPTLRVTLTGLSVQQMDTWTGRETERGGDRDDG